MRLKSVLWGWVMICSAHLSHAALVLDTAEVEQAVARGAVLWDARSPAEYAQGHLPGAINIGAVGDVFRDPHREDPPSAAVASQLFGRAGLDILRRDIVVASGFSRTSDRHLAASFRLRLQPARHHQNFRFSPA